MADTLSRYTIDGQMMKVIRGVCTLLLVSAAALLTSPASAEAPAGLKMTQTVVTLSAGVDTALNNTGGQYLTIQNIGTSRATLNFGAAAVADNGLALSAAATAGDQGGVITFETCCIPGNALRAISTVGTTLVVLEGKNQ